MELLKIWSVLLRRKWLFLQAVVFFTVGAAILSLLLPKSYEATAKISVESSDAAMSILGDLDLGEMAQSLTSSSDDMTTKIALAQMRPVLDEVVWRLQLRDVDGELLQPEKLLVPGIDGELEAMPFVTITQQQGTNILLVTASTNNPELSVLTADTMVEVFLRISQDRDKQDTRDALKFVDGELARLRTEFDNALRNVADAQSREQVIDLDSELKSAVSRVSELITQVKTADAEMADIRAQINQQEALNQRESVDGISATTIVANKRISDLRAALQAAKLSRSKELLDKTEKHPDVVLLTEQITEMTADLQTALNEQHNLDPQIENLEVQLAGLDKRRNELSAAVNETVVQFGAYPDKMREIAGLQLAADATENIYKALLEQQYEIAVAEAMTVADMKPVESAKAPDKPASPKFLVWTILGIFCGVAMGVGLVFLAEYVDDSLKDQDDLRELWPVGVLGMIPAFRLKGGRNIIDELPPTDPLFEAFRSVRNGIAFAGVDTPINIIAVTSCVPGEGKSTIITNLGICMASDGQRVIIVDCDLRRPTQHKNFPNVTMERGLSSALTGQCTTKDAIQETTVPNLHLLPAGPLPGNPGRIVESLRMRQVLQELSREYDIVLVDAPPILVVNDGLALARASKGLVVVLEAGETPRRMVSDLRNRLESAGVEATGVVLNKVDLRASNYGHYYAYAKSYGAKKSEPPAKGGPPVSGPATGGAAS